LFNAIVYVTHLQIDSLQPFSKHVIDPQSWNHIIFPAHCQILFENSRHMELNPRKKRGAINETINSEHRSLSQTDHITMAGDDIEIRIF
jgi:hypothetical protein